jgi:hypothetical protein
MLHPPGYPVQQAVRAWGTSAIQEKERSFYFIIKTLAVQLGVASPKTFSPGDILLQELTDRWVG